MSKRKSKFPPQVLSHKKFPYQEGKEDDVKFMCSNGTVKLFVQYTVLVSITNSMV